MIEICANDLQSALNARNGGAGRVELCSALSEGGLTPGPGTILLAREIPGIKLHVLIRPRSGDFLYSEQELEIIRRDIRFCRTVGCDGVVAGFLTSNGDIHAKLTREMVELAHPLEVTFHRAFDVCRNPLEALESLRKTGIKRILTSGQAVTAEQGIPLIAELVKRAGDQIIIMPGAGINESNILKIAETTGAKEFHLSASAMVESKMTFRNTTVKPGSRASASEYAYLQSDREKISKVVEIYSKHIRI
ncbi:MAG: copper homeostasis protein CutC [Bacteroidales bacterium]